MLQEPKIPDEQDLEYLRKVLQADTKAGIRIQPKKTKIFQSDVEYLGHKVSKDYIKNVQKWPRPISCKEMSSFLGIIGCYRSFIPRYSAMTNRLNAIKKALKFEWSEDMEKELKEDSRFKIQAYPDFNSNEPFILTMDWSALNKLSQEQERVERFIGCWGRKCNRKFPSLLGSHLKLRLHKAFISINQPISIIMHKHLTRKQNT